MEDNAPPMVKGPRRGTVRVHGHVIYFYGGIDDDSAMEMCIALDTIKAKDIVIKINSTGGSLHCGFAIYNSIMESRKFHKVITIGEGVVSSAATIAFQAGTERILRPFATYLIHPISGIVCGPKHVDIEDAVSNLELFRQKMHLIFCNPKLTPETYNRLMGDEKYLSPVEALNFGLCDLIA